MEITRTLIYYTFSSNNLSPKKKQEEKENVQWTMRNTSEFTYQRNM